MTDAELAAYLNLTPAEAAVIIPKLAPARRALYDRAKQLETDAALWLEELCPKPKGVLLDVARPAKRRRSSSKGPA